MYFELVQNAVSHDHRSFDALVFSSFSICPERIAWTYLTNISHVLFFGSVITSSIARLSLIAVVVILNLFLRLM